MKNKKIVLCSIVAIIVLGMILLVKFINMFSDNNQNATSIRLKWICQAQFAGIYMAEAEGFYKEEGLEVTIEPAGPNISPIKN